MTIRITIETGPGHGGGSCSTPEPDAPRILLDEDTVPPRALQRVVYVCSPYRANRGPDARRRMDRNIEIAEKLMERALLRGLVPLVPHLLYTRVLAEDIESERQLGLRAGLRLVELADELWAYTGDGTSAGMRAELARARELGIPVMEFEDL